MRSTILVLLAIVAASAAEPIRVPSGPVVQVPTPAPAKNVPLVVSPDLLYVIDADVPVIVLASPAGLLKAVEEPGPIRMKGRFADQPEKVQTRTFSGKHVYTIEVTGTGTVELLIIPVGVKDESQIVRRKIEANAGPRPPPTPEPGPKPEPDANAPFKGESGLHVLIVYPSIGMNEDQQSVVTGAIMRDKFAAAGAKVRMYPDGADASQADAAWRNAFRMPRPKTPWIYIGNGTNGESVELIDESQVNRLLEKYKVK